MNWGNIWNNIRWNAVGTLFPVVFALACIPMLIQLLGEERFGVFAIGWLITVYFSLSDFGVGAAMKQFLASPDYSFNDKRSTFWTALLCFIALAIFFASAFYFSAPWLVRNYFNVPVDLLSEVTLFFQVLAVSVVPVLLTSFYRNLFESAHLFKWVSIYRAVGALLNYVLPVLVLYFYNDLYVVMLAILLSRVFLAWFTYLGFTTALTGIFATYISIIHTWAVGVVVVLYACVYCFNVFLSRRRLQSEEGI